MLKNKDIVQNFVMKTGFSLKAVLYLILLQTRYYRLYHLSVLSSFTISQIYSPWSNESFKF